jgi:hypothetical protein
VRLPKYEYLYYHSVELTPSILCFIEMSTSASANMSPKLEPIVLEDFDEALRHLL